MRPVSSDSSALRIDRLAVTAVLLMNRPDNPRILFLIRIRTINRTRGVTKIEIVPDGDFCKNFFG